jgi:hypothetical protein
MDTSSFGYHSGLINASETLKNMLYHITGYAPQAVGTRKLF